MSEMESKGGPKKQLTMKQAIIIMSIGGFMFLLAIVIPTEPQSTAYTIKIIVGFLGLCIGVVGAYFRPMGTPKKDN